MVFPFTGQCVEVIHCLDKTLPGRGEEPTLRLRFVRFNSLSLPVTAADAILRGGIAFIRGFTQQAHSFTSLTGPETRLICQNESKLPLRGTKPMIDRLPIPLERAPHIFRHSGAVSIHSRQIHFGLRETEISGFLIPINRFPVIGRHANAVGGVPTQCVLRLGNVLFGALEQPLMAFNEIGRKTAQPVEIGFSEITLRFSVTTGCALNHFIRWH